VPWVRRPALDGAGQLGTDQRNGTRAIHSKIGLDALATTIGVFECALRKIVTASAQRLQRRGQEIGGAARFRRDVIGYCRGRGNPNTGAT
jgi:hypothetical protein